MKVEYDLAISFASEERTIARQIAEVISTKAYNVFYDEFETDKMWGKDLSVLLGEVFGETSKFCLIVISQHYIAKQWTNLEWKSAAVKALKEKDAYILPLKVDDTQLPGLSPVIGYVDLRNSSVPVICDLLIRKLGTPLAFSGPVEPGTKDDRKIIQDILSACYRRAVFTRYHAQLNQEAMFESLSDCRVQLQKLIAYLQDEKNQTLVSGIIGELDYIERINAAGFTWQGSGTLGSIDGAKLRIIKCLTELASYAGLPFAMPKSLTEELFFDKQ